MEPNSNPLTHFKEQFDYQPVVNNKEVLSACTRTVVCGMGGSAISVTLLKLFFPELPITLHNTYGLPLFKDQDEKNNTLVIINSYSGNTEESLDAFERAQKEGVDVAALSLGGILIERFKQNGGAYIQLPESSLEPRFSIGHQMIGLLTLMNEEEKITILKAKIELLDLVNAEKEGKELAEMYKGKYPILYASSNLYPVAYLIKAAINEGAKVPSFVNQIPEANHNELQSFVTDTTSNVSGSFGFLFLPSQYDHVRILKRFSIMDTMYKERGFTRTTITTNHTDILQVFTLIMKGYYMATYMAQAKNIDPYTTPFIAEFKKKITE